MVETEKDVAMCTMAATHTASESEANWVPPPVTHEFSYPFDEEIVPNPRVRFTKTILPRLSHVRSWFRGA